VDASAGDDSRKGQIRSVEQLGAVPRALISLLLGAVVAGSLVAFLPWQASALLGWDGAVVLSLSLTWIAVLQMSSDQTASHALREDSNQAVAGTIVISAGVASLAAVGLILVKASNSSGEAKAFLIVVGAMSVLLSWAAVHTVFTLRYARIYYSAPKGGVDFNENTPPTYVDFAYLAFTIGMTFQVSDTNLTSQNIRRTALGHALLSYLFGAMIIGLVINVVASLLGGG
jgi:uncharacterized membrane protein